MKSKKKCLNCNKELVGKKSNSLYCCPACGNNYRYENDKEKYLKRSKLYFKIWYEKNKEKHLKKVRSYQKENWKKRKKSLEENKCLEEQKK